MAVLDQTIESALNIFAENTSKVLGADVFSYVGGISPNYLSTFKSKIEHIC